jgi:choline dehydrogenase-like flavoprotein
MGIHSSSDPSDGDNSGAFVTTLTINPTNWTRSYSKSAYIDPYDRPNLHILTDAQVSKIAFDGTKATSVEYGDGKSVGVKKEVVLSAGPIGSPTTLMRSGVGPKDVLDGAGVSTVVELPGVGQHLQDHLASQVVFGTSAETAGLVHSNTDDARANTPEFLSYVNSAIAYINAAELIVRFLRDCPLMGIEVLTCVFVNFRVTHRLSVMKSLDSWTVPSHPSPRQMKASLLATRHSTTFRPTSSFHLTLVKSSSCSL